MSATLCILQVARDGGWVTVCRFMMLPMTVVRNQECVKWSLGWTEPRTPYECHWKGAAELMEQPAFEEHLAKVLRDEHYDLRIEQEGRVYWKLEQSQQLVKVVLATPRRKYLVFDEGVTVESYTVANDTKPIETKTFGLVKPQGPRGIPLCLRGEHLTELAEIVEHSVVATPIGQCRDRRSLPAPGYWPLTRIFVRNTQLSLIEAIRAALQKSTTNLVGFGGKTANLEVVSRSHISTFLRDFWINICHTYPLIQDIECLSTTKNDGRGWGDGSSLINPLCSDVPPSAKSSGFGFGGNFLAFLVKGKPFLVYGGCAHQVGQYTDDTFMIKGVLAQLREPITTVKIDTGWLKVGHVDEILTFPRDGTALLASPKVYKTLHSSDLSDLELNDWIEKKLRIVATALGKIGCEVRLIPVWFKPVNEDPYHVTSVRGSAVNCIYVGSYSIHSHSGKLEGEAQSDTELFAPGSKVDRYVQDLMKEFSYTSLFVDMQTANDESGAGGNVHCATFTIHLPP